MGTRANTTLAWAATGLLVVTAPFAAHAGLDEGAFEDPPAHVDDIDAGTEPDTMPSDDAAPATDTFTPGTGVDTGAGDDASGPRLPDGGIPSPLPSADTTTGCQCTQARGGVASSSYLAPSLLALGGAAIVGARRRRRPRR